MSSNTLVALEAKNVLNRGTEARRPLCYFSSVFVEFLLQLHKLILSFVKHVTVKANKHECV